MSDTQFHHFFSCSHLLLTGVTFGRLPKRLTFFVLGGGRDGQWLQGLLQEVQQTRADDHLLPKESCQQSSQASMENSNNDNENRSLLHSTILWSTQTHCALHVCNFSVLWSLRYRVYVHAFNMINLLFFSFFFFRGGSLVSLFDYMFVFLFIIFFTYFPPCHVDFLFSL